MNDMAYTAIGAWTVLNDTPTMAYLRDSDNDEIAYMPRDAAKKVARTHNAELAAEKSKREQVENVRDQWADEYRKLRDELHPPLLR